MLTEEQIKTLAKKATEQLREFWEEKEKILKKKSRDKSILDIIPEFSPAYHKAVTNYFSLLPHVDPDVFPEHLFVKKSPFQDPEEYEYIKENYKAITTSVSSEFFGITNRIFNENNYSVQFSIDDRAKKEEDKFSVYLEEDYPFNDSIFKDFRKRILKKSIIDPNGVLAFKPHEPEMIETEDGLEIDQAELIDPVAFYYSSFQRIFYDGEHAFLLTERKSIVEEAGKPVEKGLVYEYYDKDIILEIFQKGKIQDNEFEIIMLFNHEMGRIPVLPLGSNPEIFKGEIYFPSPIRDIVDPLDLVVLDSSTLLVAKNKTAYPIKIAMSEPCEADGCEGGFTIVDGNKSPCRSCLGTGRKQRDSAFTTYWVKQTDPRFEGNVSDSILNPPVQFVAPDPTILEFLRKEIDRNMNIARTMLRMGMTETKGSELSEATATGRTIDREEMFSFIKGISDDQYDLLEKSIDIIGKMRLQDDYEKPTITRPDEFAIRTSADITAEINESSGIPDIYKGKLIEEAMDKRFNMDEDNRKKLSFQITVDRLALKTDEQVEIMTAQQRVRKWEAILHDSFLNFLNEEIENDPNFLDREDAKETLILKAQQVANEISSLTNQANTVDLGTE